MASILFVNYAGGFGGGERILLDIAGGLGPHVSVACPEGELAGRARAEGLGVFCLRERRLEMRRSAGDRVATPLRLAGQAAEVRALVAALGPEVVLAWGARAAISAAAGLVAVRPRPALVFQHNDLLPGPLVARAVRAVARRADATVTISETVTRDLDPAVELSGRLRTIHPGVDLDRFRPAAGGSGPGSGERPLVLFLGALVGWKRPELALEAVALASERLPEMRLRLAGGPFGEAGEELLARVRARAEAPDLAGRVELCDLREPEAALREASCLLHCSDCEPYGMVVAEALASGVPVVAPAACGPAEIADESCARLYSPGDAEDAARALVEMLSDPARTREMGAAGRALAERRLGIERTRHAYRELVGELATKRREPEVKRAGTARAAGGRKPVGEPPTETRGYPALGLALVTVTHQSREDLERLLASAERHLPGAEVVVVDSGSSDGSIEAARAWRGGHATAIELGENAGFGRAANAGVEAARAPVTALVNPDAELLDGSLAQIARELLRPGRPERILAPLVLGDDGRREDSAQRAPASPPALASALVPPLALPAPLRPALDPWRAGTPRRAGWAVGCCLVARTETLRRLGPFDERIFLYAEDLDLGLRARELGIETWFWPAGRVRHRRAHSTHAAFGGEPFDLLARQRRAVVWERLGPARGRADDWAQLATFAGRAGLRALLRRPSERERRQLRSLARVRREPPELGDSGAATR